MAESKKATFCYAALGNVAPVILRWYNQEQITMPGEALGGLLAFLIFAVFAGVFVTFIWKEKTARQAFMIGLAFPYVLSGMVADVQDFGRVKKARAQYGGLVGGGGGARGTLGVLRISVGDISGGKPDKISARVLAADKELALTTKNPDEIYLPAGTYRVIVSAPGYKSTSTDVTVAGSESKTLPVTLFKTKFVDDVWSGFRAVILPYRETPDPQGKWPAP